MIRNLKIIFASIFALWGILGGLMNLAGYQMGYGAVEAVVSMAHMDPELRPAWATENAVIVHLGFALIWGLKLLGGVFLAIGARQMWQARTLSADHFNAAKEKAVVGLGVLLIMLIGGFNLFAANIFAIWAGPIANAFDISWAFAGEIGLVMLFMHMHDD